MPFVQAKCPECGGMLAVDDSKKAAMCQFCGEAFIVQEAVNNYITNNITNNTTNHNYGEGVVVNLYEEKSNDFIIEAGVLKKYIGADDSVVIPDNVKAIGEACFENMSIVEVILHDGIKRIENGAFFKCGQLKTINIPKSVEYIGQACFFACSELEEIVFEGPVSGLLPKTQYHYYGPGDDWTEHWGTFQGCSKLSKVIFNQEQENIPDYCFFGCHLDDLYVPVKCNITSKSFEECSLKKVVLDNKSELNTNLLSKITVGTLIIKDIDNYNASLLKDINAYCILIDSDTENELEQWSMMQKVKTNTKSINIRTNKCKDNLVWKFQNKCQYCGGDFDYPLFGKPKCKKCGKKKDY